MAKASSYIGSDKAVGRLPPFSGKGVPRVETILRNHGFKLSSTSASSKIYIHQDGSQVRIDPAHNPGNPKINTIDAKPFMSHIRGHFHKLWTDGVNILSLNDHGYVVKLHSANAHIPSKKKTKESEFERLWLFEAPFFRQTDLMTTTPSSSANQQWLFELPPISLEYHLDSEEDLMLGKTLRNIWNRVTGQNPSAPPSSSRPSAPPSSSRSSAPYRQNAVRTRQIVDDELKTAREDLKNQEEKYGLDNCPDRIAANTKVFPAYEPARVDLCLRLRASMAKLRISIGKLEKELKQIK